MVSKFFDSFSQASNYAKEEAILNKSTFEIRRKGNSWEVYPHLYIQEKSKAEIAKQDQNYFRKRKLTELRAQKLHAQVERQKKQLDDEAARRAKEEYLENQAKRQAYLKERFDFYGTCSEEELLIRWEEKMELNSDEQKVLRAVIRRKKGLVDKSPLIRPRVCGQCGMVESSCTCSRSWF